MSRQWAFSLVGLVAILLAGPAVAQGNIDAGKSPAQIFSDTCGNCHRSPSQVRRASASFLRSHYTTGSDEAAAMARYLANVPNEPRTPPSQQKKEAARPKETPAETPRRAEPKEQARGPAASSKSNRRGAAEAKSAAASTSGLIFDSKPPEPQPEVAPPPAPAAPKPALEPFEE